MAASPPGPVAAQRRGRATFALFCVAAFGLQLWLAAPDELVASPNPYDQLRYAEMAEALEAGRWLGAYGPLTLLRAPGYPIWVALVERSGLPLRLAAECLLAASALGFALTLLRIGASAGAAAAAFGVLVLQPHAFLVDRELLPEGFYLPVLLAALAGLALAAQTRHPAARALHAAWAGAAAGVLWVSRPETFLIPGLLACAAGVELWLRRREPARGLLRDALLLVGAAVGGAGAVIGGVAAANYRHYGLAVVSEPSAPGYLAAQRALLAVEHSSPRRFVPVPTEVRARVYAVSPSFRRLEARLEEPSWGRRVSCAQLRVCDDLGAYFFWMLREAVAAADGARGAPATDAYFRRIAEEVRAACSAGALRCRASPFPFLHPYASTWLPHLWDSLRALSARIGSAGTASDLSPPRDDTALAQSLRRRFDALAHRRPERTSERWFEVAGFAESAAPLASVSLRAGPGAAPALVGVAGQGGAERIDFGFRWERLAAPAARLEIARASGDSVEVALARALRAPVRRDGVRVAIETLEPLQPEPESRRRVRRALWSLHALWVRGVGAAGLVAAVVCLTPLRRGRRSAAFWVATATLSVAVASRLLLLAVIHASAFPTDTSRYLYPVIPLYSCLMLLLVDAALAGRRLGRAPP